MKSIQKKAITFILILSLGVFPNVVNAQMTDFAAQAQRVIQILKDYGLDTLANSLAQMAGAKLSNKIVNKSTGGASGDSSQNGFIDSFADYFGNLSNEQIDRFVTDLGISNSPYAAGISKAVIQDAQGIAGGKSPLSSFNLDKVIGGNYKDFENNASLGGWSGFLALSNPANSNIGSSLLAKQEIQDKIAKAKELEQLKLTSPGIKPQGKCNKSFSDYKADIIKLKNKKEGNTTTQDTSEDPERAQPSEDPERAQPSEDPERAQPSEDPERAQPSEDPERAQPSSNLNTKDGKVDNKKNPVDIGLIEDYGGCLEEFINNPVGTSTSLLTSALDAGAKQLSASDEIGEMIAGMVLGLVNSFIKGGLTALNADFKPSRSSVGGSEALVGANGQNINWTSTPYTIVDLQEEFPSAMSATRYELGLLRQYSNLVTKDDNSGTDFAHKIVTLDQCIPGPDFRYTQRLKIYKKAQLTKLGKMKEKGKDSNKKWRQAIYDDVETSVDYAITEMELASQRAEMNIPGAATMTSQISMLKGIRTTFQQNQKDIISKQVTINILSQVESILKSSVKSLNSVDPTLAIPADIAFTDHNWELMTPAQQNTFTNWAKKLYKMPEKAPLNGADWDALSVADKATVMTWAKKIQGLDAVPTGSTEKDIALASSWLVAGVDPGDVEPTTTCDEACTVKKKLAVGAIWSLWVNPERYITDLTNWVPGNTASINTVTAGNTASINTVTAGNTVFDKFIKDKSNALNSFKGVATDVAIPYTIEKAETEIKKIQASIESISKLGDDCNKMKLIINQNSSLSGDPDGHAKMLAILKTRVKEFTTAEIRDAITNGQSMLSDRIGSYQADPINNCGAVADPRLNPLYGQDPNLNDPNSSHHSSFYIQLYWAGLLNDYNNRDTSGNRCKQDIGELGSFNDGENPEDPELTAIGNIYQVQPAKDVWQLLGQGDIALCRLNKFTSDYVYFASKNYKPIQCDPDGWMKISKKTIVSYMFSENIAD